MRHDRTKVLKALKRRGFDAYVDEDGWLRVTCYMDHGEEKCVEIPPDVERCHEWLQNEIDTFDESESAYVWLDEFGHGRNGAPYDMEDVLADQKQWTRTLEKMYSIARKAEINEK